MEAHHNYSSSMDALYKINLDEEEKDMLSFFFDSSFDREHLKSLPSPKEGADSQESHVETLSEHIDISDENFDVFGFRFLHSDSQKPVIQKSVLQSDNGTEFLKTFTIQVIDQEKFLNENDADQFPILAQRLLLTKHTKCYYSTKYTIFVIMRYCIFVLSYCKAFSSTSHQQYLLNALQDVCKILNTLLIGKKFSESEIKLEKKIPDNVLEFPFDLKETETSESATTVTEQKDTLSKILTSIFSTEQGVEAHNCVSSLIVGNKCRSSMSFEKLIKQVRMYLIVSLRIGDYISASLSSILTSFKDIDILNVLCGVLQVLAKPMVRTEQVPIQQLVLSCVQSLQKQQDKTSYPADMLRDLAVVVLKTYPSIGTCKQVFYYLLQLVSVQIITQDVEKLSKSTEFLSNYVYLLDNIQMQDSHAFADLRQEIYTFHAPSNIVSEKIDLLFPLPSIVVDERERGKNEASKEVLQCSSADVFSRSTISRLITIAETAGSKTLTTHDHYSTFLANFFLLLNHLLHNENRIIRANVANEILDNSNFSIFCKLGDDKQFRDLRSQCLFSIASLDECVLEVFEKMNIIDIGEDVFKFFVTLTLRNASRNKAVFEKVWMGYMYHLRHAVQSSLSQEKMLFLALCFDTMDSTSKVLIFSEYIKRIKTELSTLKSKILAGHVLALFEYLCKNFDSMPTKLSLQLSDFFQNTEHKLKITYNSLLDKLGVRNDTFFEIDYEHSSELSFTAVSILKQNDECTELIRALLENITQLSDSDDKVILNAFDYTADISIRLLNALLKLDSIKKVEATSVTTDRLSYLIQYIHNHDMNQKEHLSKIFDMIMIQHDTDAVSSGNNSILSLVYIKECLSIIEKYASQQTDWTPETVDQLLKRLCNFCGLAVQHLDLIIQKDLMHSNQMNEEESCCGLSLIQSALSKETVMTCIGLLTSSGTVKTSTANISEWYDSKLNTLKNIADISSEKSLWKLFFYHIIGSVHVSHRNLQAFSCYSTIRSNIDMISKVTTIVKEKGYNISIVMPDLVALLLKLREHYVYRSSLLVEPIMFNLFSEGFVNELNIFRTFTVGKVLSSLQESDLISKKPSSSHKIISTCFEYLEDFILSKGKRMQSIQSLMFGEPEIPKFCTAFRFDAVVLIKI
ncbi:hypothetical protein C9374_004125 [Naegleria lovaniensis]|uniref:Uncharacterized protein n=1 Tax=Naegleria lovaniensis TaxID=51637 RepID=A0AA88GQS0_NAELO|nr:uncharacterized protein C9374_004125 [Naegleria lovaniensis]KAG2383454.1 hypothetical protein C9374_004125 [Naegleria lovaniensis]